MSALQRIAHFKNRRDEVPNQELARAASRSEKYRKVVLPYLARVKKVLKAGAVG